MVDTVQDGFLPLPVLLPLKALPGTQGQQELCSWKTLSSPARTVPCSSTTLSERNGCFELFRIKWTGHHVVKHARNEQGRMWVPTAVRPWKEGLCECLLFGSAAGYYRREKLSSLETCLTSFANIEQLYYRNTNSTDMVNVGTRVSSTADFLLHNSESMCFLLKIYEQKIEFRGTSPHGFPSNTVFTFEASTHANLPQVTGNKNNLSFPSPLDFHLLEHLNLLWQRQGNKEPSQAYPSRPKAPDWLNIVTFSQAPSLWERNCKNTSSRTVKWRRCTGSSPIKHLY